MCLLLFQNNIFNKFLIYNCHMCKIVSFVQLTGGYGLILTQTFNSSCVKINIKYQCRPLLCPGPGLASHLNPPSDRPWVYLFVLCSKKYIILPISRVKGGAGGPKSSNVFSHVHICVFFTNSLMNQFPRKLNSKKFKT